MSTLEEILINKNSSCQSVWFMRQAGRYLPEFRKVRLQNNNFINLCLNSSLSSEITLQPIKRFDLDSAIIFSDILLVPYALGQKVEFIKNKGPNLSKFKIEKFLENKKNIFKEKLNPIYKAITITRKKLRKEKSLIGFIGAPWTLLVYMLSLKENKNQINIEDFKKQGQNINLIMNNLIDYLCIHIEEQANAGVDVIQIFDSWAGLLPDKSLQKLCFEPNLKIVNFCKRKNIPVICFPKGIREKYQEFCNIVKPDGVNLDYNLDPLWAKENLTNVALQGGMNPQMLLKSDKEMYSEAKKYLEIFKDVPYIFNLGHGIVPETEPNKIEKLIQFIRKQK